MPHDYVDPANLRLADTNYDHKVEYDVTSPISGLEQVTSDGAAVWLAPLCSAQGTPHL